MAGRIQRSFSKKTQRIAVIGAGPIGLTLSILLTKLQHHHVEVDLYEKRSLTQFESPPDDTRVLGTTFTCRGYRPICLAGLANAYGVQLNGTQIHLPPQSSLCNTQYSYQNGREGDLFYSLNRKQLLTDLKTLFCQQKSSTLYWDHQVLDIDFETGVLKHSNGSKSAKSKQYDAIFAADGVYSQIRNKLHQNGNLRQSLTKCDLGYLYIEIPSLCRDLINTDDSSNYIFDKHSFHTFPTKEKCFTVVLPEPGGKFSASFYLMRDAYSKLIETGQLRDYLKSLFPQLYDAVPDFDKQLERKTLRDIVSVKLEPSWSYKDKLCCIGDASHAIFPFYGSGLNTGLEDVSEIISLVEQHDFQWDIIFQEFYRLRKPNTDAIQELTLNRLESFMNEMRDPQYGQFRNALDILNNSYGDSFWSVERLVRFSHVPYNQIFKFLQTEKAIVETILGKDDSIRRALKEGIRKVERVASTESMIEQMMREHREIVEHIKSPQIK
ncbi:hypothetical protein FGO68_gene10336 [Halteria grandinella]|uniref:Squalene epoxidase domain-containing protein n=1 Tax=Halteria grandinella TaxID=5974 RepID=A0A8J8NS98_HALGN|nr:hypothetical protein FGO68_gene10336 [Halteria grandinella]